MTEGRDWTSAASHSMPRGRVAGTSNKAGASPRSKLARSPQKAAAKTSFAKGASLATTRPEGKRRNKIDVSPRDSEISARTASPSVRSRLIDVSSSDEYSGSYSSSTRDYSEGSISSALSSSSQRSFEVDFSSEGDEELQEVLAGRARRIAQRQSAAARHSSIGRTDFPLRQVGRLDATPQRHVAPVSAAAAIKAARPAAARASRTETGAASRTPMWLRQALEDDDGPGEATNDAAAGMVDGLTNKELQRIDMLTDKVQRATMAHVGTSLTELRKATSSLHEAEAEAREVREHAVARRHGRIVSSAQGIAERQYREARAARRVYLEERAHAPSADAILAADPFERETYKPLVRLHAELVAQAEADAKERSLAVERSLAAERRARAEAEREEALTSALDAAHSAQHSMMRRRSVAPARQLARQDSFSSGGSGGGSDGGGRSSRRGVKGAKLWQRAAAAASGGDSAAAASGGDSAAPPDTVALGTAAEDHLAAGQAAAVAAASSSAAAAAAAAPSPSPSAAPAVASAVGGAAGDAEDEAAARAEEARRTAAAEAGGNSNP